MVTVDRALGGFHPGLARTGVLGVALCLVGCGSSPAGGDAAAGEREVDGDAGADMGDPGDVQDDQLCARFVEILAPVSCPDEGGRLERCALDLANGRCQAEAMLFLRCVIDAGTSVVVCDGSVTSIRMGSCDEESTAYLTCRLPPSE